MASGERRSTPRGVGLAERSAWSTFIFMTSAIPGTRSAASTGASTKELMARMGHASPRAALIYQHATEERDVVIAEGLSQMVRDALGS